MGKNVIEKFKLLIYKLIAHTFRKVFLFYIMLPASGLISY